ncbi:hypothetical protein CASFOL_014458 [Castilleja foliolosa]|uniref:Mitotic checkpoint protein BUB3.3 n=1 Tax=Castilleja foliolosa TaxID=1961234 RepID=A0ABD3DMX3_9LAMI
MNGSCLSFDNPIRDAISRIRFAPVSNNLLISSWDSCLRFYDADKCELRLEASTDGPALLDCCFESESIALSANSDGSILSSISSSTQPSDVIAVSKSAELNKLLVDCNFPSICIHSGMSQEESVTTKWNNDDAEEKVAIFDVGLTCGEFFI